MIVFETLFTIAVYVWAIVLIIAGFTLAIMILGALVGVLMDNVIIPIVEHFQRRK